MATEEESHSRAFCSYSWDFHYLAFIVQTLDLIMAFNLMQGGELKMDAPRWTTLSALCLADEAIV